MHLLTERFSNRSFFYFLAFLAVFVGHVTWTIYFHLMEVEEKIVVRLAPGQSGLYVTMQELNIVKLIVAGKKTREIAEDLGISPSTVGAHRNNMLDRLHCAHTPQLIAKLFRNNLLQ